MKLLTLIFLLITTTVCIITDAAFSQARQIATHHHHQPQSLAIQSFKHNITMLPDQIIGGCSYTATVITSCSSPPSTRDLISLVFGDAYGNQAYVERLDNPASGRFSRCSTDILRIDSTICVQQICSFQLIRFGMDGWMPETITISGPNLMPLQIIYQTFLPEATWFGVNQC